ncbi:MAG: tol-pal system-associated acyl-CoA thioesterase [Gammaproteobacteria bacterium]|nr:tol-pal system-associated acyl-CoA thioesterase [Gammaproteobacteria bacterium]|tara:strand:+ start:1048 stop:1458 length:411 start_codon:yes stop_codon:yes gene_type:complete
MSGNFSYEVRIFYEDTDSGGIVYYANYLKFMERARSELIRELGFTQSSIADKYSLKFVVSRINLNFINPSYLDDIITVNTRISSMKKASIVFEQEIINQNSDRIVEAECQIVCVDNELNVIQIPDNINKALRKFYG